MRFIAILRQTLANWKVIERKIIRPSLQDRHGEIAKVLGNKEKQGRGKQYAFCKEGKNSSERGV